MSLRPVRLLALQAFVIVAWADSSDMSSDCEENADGHFRSLDGSQLLQPYSRYALSFRFNNANVDHAVRWGFQNANVSAISEFEDWDRQEGPSSANKAVVILSNVTAWPPISATRDGLELPGLRNPLVRVVSMPDKLLRRKQFRDMYKGLKVAVGATWFPAVVGKLVPDHLRWLRGFVDNTSWDYDKPGVFGCFLSHLAILRQSQQECPDCDLLVFEDDVIFAPSFLQNFSDFVESLPHDWDMLRIGGQALWDPPFEYTPKYIRVDSQANTWGYVVRANRVKRLADFLAALPVKGDWGIDGIFELVAKEFKTYAPTVPLVYTNSLCHDTSKVDSNSKLCEENSESPSSMFSRWPQGYARTYCVRRGMANQESTGRGLCRDDESNMGCCPYLEPPYGVMT
eukprot:TRINITY_DN12505_c0_g1_i1.p1 TRINITY_DN12505_c0_g1~~TRINITY_DN12505_c0_g1_i1.p1  ORF type:complete len:399 (+),score=42.91 TRINITY_DN12505_c0_g1_i1:80-1276(+)